MLSNYKHSFLFLFFLIFAVGCNSQFKQEKREFSQLEDALQKIAMGDEKNWLNTLEDVEQLPIKTERVKHIQTLCVNSYKEYANALTMLHETKQKVIILQKSIDNKLVKNLEQKQNDATVAMEKTNAYIETSEALIQKCLIERNDAKQKYGVIRK